MSRHEKVVGIVLIIVGLAILLNNLDIEFGRYAWPLAIVVFGAYLIYRAAQKRDAGGNRDDSSKIRLFVNISKQRFR